MTDIHQGSADIFCAHDELVAIERVIGNPRNPNMHPSEQIALLAKIIGSQGWRAPITVSRRSGFVVRGHGRLAAAKLLGLDTVPVDFQDYESEAAEWADLIADNRIAELAEPDMPMLLDLLQELDTGDFDMELTGFDFENLERLLTSFADADAEVEEDDVPEVPVDPITKVGDLWLLGKHRLLCGDATSPEDVGRLMADRSASMMFTDPPWNVGIGQDSNPKHRQRQGLANDSLPPEEFQRFLDGFVSAVSPQVSGDVYCVLGASEWPRLDATLRTHGFHWSATVIWVKDTFVLGRSKYHRRYEPIWYGWAEGSKSSFCARRDLDDVWEVPRPKRSEEHPTMKPVALVARALTNSSTLKSIVLDPFLGSGTTLIAAEQLGRICYGLELDPGYCDVIVERWENLTGQKAVLDSSGREESDGPAE